MPDKKVVLFDFDGVIVASFDLAMTVVRDTGDNMTKDEYRKLFEGNVYDSLDEHHKTSRKKRNDDLWWEFYVPRILKLEPVKEVVEEIERLHRKYKLVIVTSSINSPIEKYLEKYNLVKHFDKIFGSDIHKSKVKKIEMVFDKYNVQPNDCIFITDTLGDMREATKTGVDSIGVTWGFHPKETLLKGTPVNIIDNPKKLYSEVEKYFEN